MHIRKDCRANPTFEYKGIALKLITRNYTAYKARRFLIITRGKYAADNQNVWIPCKHLTADGNKIKDNENIDYIFQGEIEQKKLMYAGYSKKYSPLVTVEIIKEDNNE